MNTYRYGPLERPGAILGIRLGQIFVAGATIVLAFISFVLAQGVGMHLLAILPVFFVLALGVVALRAPIPPFGRTFDEIGPPLASYLYRRLRGRDAWLTSAYHKGQTVGIAVGRSRYLEPFDSKPPFLRHLDLLAAHDPETMRSWAVVHDRMTDEYIAVLPCQGPGTALLDEAELSDMQAVYSEIIATYGLRDHAPICAIGWTERIVPDQGEDVVRHMLSRFKDRGGMEVARENYRQLVGETAPVSQQHELFLELVLSGKNAAGQMYRLGQGNRPVGAALLLQQEADHLRRLLEGAEIIAGPLLTPRELAQSIRVAFLPDLRQTRSLIERAGGERGIPMENSWPGYVRTHMHYVESDGWYHRAYFVREWPKTDVGPDFLAPLMRGVSAMRSFSVTMEPIPIIRSQGEWNKRQMDLTGKLRTKEKMKFDLTPADLKEQEAHQRVGEQIADGHPQVRFRGFITVSARTLDELESECVEVTTAASQARLELETMYGQQDLGMASTLPLGRGR